MAWEDINPREILIEKIRTKGGWVNTHAHIDRAYIINDENWHLTSGTLEQKWDYMNDYKANASVDEIVSHMARAIDFQLEQGVSALGTFIDCDTISKDKSLKAAQIIRDRYRKDLQIKFIHQPLRGLIDPEERKWFEEAAQFVDILGGLPERDSRLRHPVDHSGDHLDILFETGKKLGKPLHVHIDQMNDPEQHDTELLIDKTREHQYGGNVTAIHGLSIAAQQKARREKIYAGLVEQKISFVACPTAWIDSRRNEIMTPFHNSVTPVDEMVAAGVTVALGTDNIADILKPFSDGDMWTELRVLLEATHVYDIDALAEIATTNGRKALFLD